MLPNKYKKILKEARDQGIWKTYKKHKGLIHVRLHFLIGDTIDFIFSPFYYFIGARIQKGYIWAPKSYKKNYNPFHFWFIEKPLARRGVFLPIESPKDGSKFATFNNEHITIKKLIQSILTNINKYFVDIGAGDGIEMSNTYLLAANDWQGLSIEVNVNKFAKMATIYQRYPKIGLVRASVTPENIIDLLRYAGTPKDFGILSLDIDGYDYYVLEKILSEFKPQIIVAEINAMIPINISFSIKYTPDFMWKGSNNFQGMSLTMLKSLADSFNYDIVEANGCAAFLVRQDISSNFRKVTLEELEEEVIVSYYEIDQELRRKLNKSPKEALRYITDELFKNEDRKTYVADIAKNS